MFDNLMQNLLLNAKNQVDDQKKQFEDKFIDFISTDQKIKIKVNANGKIKDLEIDVSLFDEGKEALEDFLVVNINRAIDLAENYRTNEIDKVKKDIMPNINDIFNSLNIEE